MRLFFALAISLIAGCAAAPDNRWKGGDYALDGWSVRLYATDEQMQEEWIGRNTEILDAPTFWRWQAASVGGWTDLEHRVIHAVTPTSGLDAEGFCILGHELYHALEGAWHPKPVASCVPFEGGP